MFLNFFKPKYNGALIDTRSEEEKAKDWQAEEIFSFGVPTFPLRAEGTWRKYTVRNQAQSGSCVANSQAKFLEVMKVLNTGTTTVFSHAPVYQRRANKPTPGMGYPDAPKLQVSVGSCPESDMPSMNLSDAQLDFLQLPLNFDDINDDAKPSNFVAIPLDFYKVADYIQKNGAAIIWFDSSYSHWNKDIPTPGGKGGGVRHSVCAVDAINFNRTNYIVIEDSWGLFGKYKGQRLISAEFFKDAAFLAYALINFTYEPKQAAFEPFLSNMQFGQKSDEIKRLQKYLRSKGCYPNNVDTTGYYGQVTAQSVLTFQLKYNVDKPSALHSLKGKTVGPKTRSVINANLV